MSVSQDLELQGAARVSLDDRGHFRPDLHRLSFDTDHAVAFLEAGFGSRVPRHNGGHDGGWLFNSDRVEHVVRLFAGRRQGLGRDDERLDLSIAADLDLQ